MVTVALDDAKMQDAVILVTSSFREDPTRNRAGRLAWQQPASVTLAMRPDGTVTEWSFYRSAYFTGFTLGTTDFKAGGVGGTKGIGGAEGIGGVAKVAVRAVKAVFAFSISLTRASRFAV